MDRKRKLFKDVVFDLLKDIDSYDKQEYQLLRCYDLFFKQVPTFKKMDVETQYYICETAMLIHFGASSKGMREARILSCPPPSETEIKYCVEYGFEEPGIMELKNTKLLNSKPLNKNQ